MKDFSNRNIRLSPDVVGRTIEGEAVLLNLASGTYLGLNQVGTRIWELLSAGEPVDAVITQLLSEFDVTRDVLESDVDEILNEMQAKGVLL